ncbi:MAG: hypothetical protein GX660_10940 [Clostridiaceae bacterium]|nr:hypothetical protein [Clostridiaceae bacterium]
MARMIPSVVSPEIKSNAERRIFEWFRDDPITEDWIVLHSLGISNHNKVIHGETDFFVLAPYIGMFALEVKGGRVRRSDGVWSFTDKYGNIATKERGPFDQAWDGIYSIIASLKNKYDSSHQHLNDIFYGIGVMFPDIEYETVGCDEEQWQVFDCNDANHVGNFIKRLFDATKKKWEDLYHVSLPYKKLPTIDDVAYIVSLLRGDFDKAVSISVQMKYAEEELVELTKEQYRCLDQLDDNPRCLIQGAAGTGKTLLAIEEAKKTAASGQRVALFCFNNFLGDWMRRYFEDVPSNLQPAYVGTFHSYMINLAKCEGIRLNFPESEENYNAFFREDVPVSALMALVRNGADKFDKIIIDEAQDLISPLYIDVMDACLRKGFVRGKWTMLGDFSMQAIYAGEKTGDQMKEMIEDRTSFIRFKLTINCRNTKPICDEIETVTGFEAPSDIWTKVEGPPVNYITYKDAEDERTKLESIIDSLVENRVAQKKITILSPVKRENSVVSLIEKYEIKNYRAFSTNIITFSTIQGFKGLENAVIILTDISSYEDIKLMYVAFSRARTGLYVLETESAANEYVKLQMRRLLL